MTRAVTWGGKALFQLTVAAGHPGKSGQESNHKHGGHGDVMLAGLPQGLLSLLCYTTQDQMPRDYTTHSGLDPPDQSLIKKMPYRCLQTNLIRHFLS